MYDDNKWNEEGYETNQENKGQQEPSEVNFTMRDTRPEERGERRDAPYGRDDNRNSYESSPDNSYGGYRIYREEEPHQEDARAERIADRSYIPEEPKRRSKNKTSMAGRIAGVTAAALLFGVVAGGTMIGVNSVYDHFSGGKYPTVDQTDTMEDSDQTEASEAARETEGTVVPTAISGDVSAIVDMAMPSVVAINNTMLYQSNGFFGSQTYKVPASGSGIIVGQNENELLVVTNNHVVQDSTSLQVNFIDGTSVNAAIKGTDSDSDLAIIAVPLKDIPAETMGQIKAATLGDSDSLKAGQGVIAIGNALGYGQSVTVGYISALNREVTTDNVTRTLLQTDAAINPGNSGGALLNMKGEVIGINAAKYASTDVEGIGYAIPISFAQDIMKDLMNRATKIEVPEEEQGYLGIQLQNIDRSMSEAFGMPQGIYVYKIVEDSAAAKSDLRERDIITKIDGETVKNGEDLQKMLTYYKAGTKVTLTVQSVNNGKYEERQVEVTLGEKPEVTPTN